LRTLRRISEQAMEVLLMLAVPTIAGIFFLGQWALSVLYKNPTFVEAVPALHILSWMLVLQVFSSILGQVLVATHREKLTLKIAMASAIVNRSEEHTSELQSLAYLVCRLLLEKKNNLK